MNKAFSLIELMIVVAIIAFLSTIALPKYFTYTAKAKQAEVAVILASIHTAQQAYWAEHGTYSNILSGEGGIGWKPQGYKGDSKNENFYYTYGFNCPGAQEGINYFTGKLGTPISDIGQTNATQDSFTAGAAGNILDKNKADVWQIDENRKITHIKDGIN